jgi:hypothetical protein
MTIRRWDKNWLEVPLIENNTIDYHHRIGLSGDVRREIRNFMKDVVNVIGPSNMKKKYPTGSYYKIANDMLHNAYDSLKNNRRSISFDIAHLPNETEREYFYARLDTFFEEIISTRTVNEKYLLVFEYHDQSNRTHIDRKLLTDDTVMDIRRQIMEGKFGFRTDHSNTDVYFRRSGESRSIIVRQALDRLTIIDLNNNMNNPIRKLHEGSFWKWLNMSNINLERYMIFKKLSRRERDMIGNDNCLIYALRQTNKFEESLLDRMREVIKCDAFPITKLRKISIEFDISLTIINYDLERPRKEYYWAGNHDPIELLLYKGHYMLNEKVKDIPLVNLLKQLFDKDLFKPITIKDISRISVPKDINVSDLEYCDKFCCHLKKPYATKGSGT